LRIDLIDREIDGDRLPLLMVLHSLDAAGFGRDDIGLAAGPLDHSERLEQFGLLEAVGRDHGEALALQTLRHDRSPQIFGATLCSSKPFARSFARASVNSCVRSSTRRIVEPPRGRFGEFPVGKIDQLLTAPTSAPEASCSGVG
jgi:hypothetical protein